MGKAAALATIRWACSTVVTPSIDGVVLEVPVQGDIDALVARVGRVGHTRPGSGGG
jgi:acyl-CoA hydrolase